LCFVVHVRFLILFSSDSVVCFRFVQLCLFTFTCSDLFVQICLFNLAVVDMLCIRNWADNKLQANVLLKLRWPAVTARSVWTKSSSYSFDQMCFFRFVSSDSFLHICLFISCWMIYLFLWIRFFRFIWSDSFYQICLFIFGSWDCIVQICFFRFMIRFFASSCLLCGAVVLHMSLLQLFARCVSWLCVCVRVCVHETASRLMLCVLAVLSFALQVLLWCRSWALKCLSFTCFDNPSPALGNPSQVPVQAAVQVHIQAKYIYNNLNIHTHVHMHMHILETTSRFHIYLHCCTSVCAWAEASE
jgi:hypothetical protein